MYVRNKPDNNNQVKYSEFTSEETYINPEKEDKDLTFSSCDMGASRKFLASEKGLVARNPFERNAKLETTVFSSNGNNYLFLPEKREELPQPYQNAPYLDIDATIPICSFPKTMSEVEKDSASKDIEVSRRTGYPPYIGLHKDEKIASNFIEVLKKEGLEISQINIELLYKLKDKGYKLNKRNIESIRMLIEGKCKINPSNMQNAAFRVDKGVKLTISGIRF